jgi:hypothetical protein
MSPNNPHLPRRSLPTVPLVTGLGPLPFVRKPIMMKMIFLLRRACPGTAQPMPTIPVWRTNGRLQRSRTVA